MKHAVLQHGSLQRMVRSYPHTTMKINIFTQVSPQCLLSGHKGSFWFLKSGLSYAVLLSSKKHTRPRGNELKCVVQQFFIRKANKLGYYRKHSKKKMLTYSAKTVKENSMNRVRSYIIHVKFHRNFLKLCFGSRYWYGN
jgi:hypothetical protein